MTWTSHVEITFRISNAFKILVGKIVRKKTKLTELKKKKKELCGLDSCD